MLGGFPPRYIKLLWLTLAAALPRLVPWIPFGLAYCLPLGLFSKLLVIFMPVLWYAVVGPMRVRYGAALTALARDPAASLSLRQLYQNGKPWHHTFRGRVDLMRGRSLPMAVIIAFILAPLWMMDNVFAAIETLLTIPAWIASAIATVVAFLPRIIAGKPAWVDAGVLGGMIVLAVLLLASCVLFLWAVFQTSAHRFGYTRLPRKGTLKPLLGQNTLLWLPTIVLGAALLTFAYQELLLVFANFISIEAVFVVKFEPLQLALLGATGLSYILLLPLRRYNTARWAAEHA